ILTQEDWNTVLYNGMARTSPWAALYFIALMTFGNYVLFNLLVAILVEDFPARKRPVLSSSTQFTAPTRGLGSQAATPEDGRGHGREPTRHRSIRVELIESARSLTQSAVR
uniref:Ion_trans domain-containing protein n=1 Tax=Macrostomum lignano TaxID=282301 RepID=A0A1I8FS04_9PLAT